MAAGEDKNIDFYSVLGLKKECSALELRNAYKKLALRWHPDRFSASGNPKSAEEAKKKFQLIQEAYSVLSDVDKRFMYDVGVYDSDDDEKEMGDFLGEMAAMMNQTQATDSFEDIQELFEEMFHRDVDTFGSTSSSYSSSSSSSNSNISNNVNKRNCPEIGSRQTILHEFSVEPVDFRNFCFGTGARNGRVERQRRKSSRKA